MRTITFSGAHNSVPVLFPEPSRPLLASYVFSLQSDSKLNHTSKLFLRNPSPISSRHSNQWILRTCDERFGWFVQTSQSPNDHEYSSHVECKNCEETTDPIRVTDDYVTLSEALVNKNPGMKFDKPMDFLLSDNSVGNFLKIMLLFGCFTLQGSEPALASTDFSSGISSLTIFQDLGDITTGFASAFLLIFFSELGDKTFFIAALLAARNSAAVVFAGTFGALAAMTIISVALGRTFHYVDEILPFSFGGNDLPLDDIAAVLLLVYFGVSTLLDASSSDGLKAEEEQKEAELAVSEFSGNGAGIVAAASTVFSTFFLVFVAEWGDKSFFSTIALAAASSPLGVIAGALAGHGVATLLAVLGGSLLGSFLSEKAIAYVGGVLFLVFACITLVNIVN